MKKRTIVLIILTLAIDIFIACGKEKLTTEKNENLSAKNTSEWLIFFRERKIYKSSDEKSEVLGSCSGLQPLELLDSYKQDLRNEKGFKIGVLYKLIKCRGIQGWIRYDSDVEYGSFNFLQTNLETIKKGYEFQNEIGGTYEAGDISTYFNFESLLIDLNQGGGNIKQQYSNFNRIAPNKWTLD